MTNTKTATKERKKAALNLRSTRGSDSKECSCSAGDMHWIPGLGRSPGGGHGNPLQSSRLENPHGQRSLAGYGPWGGKVHVPKSQTQLKRLSTAQPRNGELKTSKGNLHNLPRRKSKYWKQIYKNKI